MRPTLPVHGRFSVGLDAGERRALEALAARLRAEDPSLGTLTAFGPRVRAGACAAPAVFLEDHLEITLFHGSGDRSLEYRALLLAGDGDVVLVGGPRRPEFEAYCRDVLGLGAPEVLEVRPEPQAPRLPVALRVLRDADALTRLIALAGRHGGLNLVPYFGTSSAWALGSVLADSARVPVHVLAAPPKLTAHVNDKLWFARRVAEVLGRGARPVTALARHAAQLVERLSEAARTGERWVIKVPDAAASVGNVVVEPAELRARGPAAVAERILAHLGELGWEGEWPLLVSHWDEPVVESPSVQLWIPPRPAAEEGAPADPVVEGVFTQLLGSAGEFMGGAPSRLPAAVQARLAQEAVYLGGLLQALGYVGRCSLDAILVGDDPHGATPHWIECNGRWGGMSIPMTLANRLVGRPGGRLGGSGAPASFVTVTYEVPRAASLGDLLVAWDDLLWRPGRREGLVVMSPGPFAAGQRCHLVSVSASGRLEAALALSRRRPGARWVSGRTPGP